MSGVYWKKKNLSELVYSTCKTHSFHLIARAETITSKHPIKSIIMKFGFYDYDFIPCQGKSRGIWVLWNSSKVNVSIIHKEQRFIGLLYRDNLLNQEFIVVFIYGPAQRAQKAHFWEELENFCKTLDKPFIVMSDFNEIASLEDKMGGTRPTNDWFQTIADFKYNTDTRFIPFKGNKFTWRLKLPF